MSIPHIDLVARRQGILDDDRPDYHIFAGEQMVGRIYRGVTAGNWLWAINSVFTSREAGVRLHGDAGSFDEARDHLRVAFDLWLAWVQSLPSDHKSARTFDAQLRRIGRKLDE